MSQAQKEKYSESKNIKDKIDEIIALEKVNKYEFIRRVIDFYVENKVLLISEDKISEGYKEMGDINLTFAEEGIFSDSESIELYEKYLSSDTNIMKGADLSFAERNRYSKKYRHGQTR